MLNAVQNQDGTMMLYKTYDICMVLHVEDAMLSTCYFKEMCSALPWVLVLFHACVLYTCLTDSRKTGVTLRSKRPIACIYTGYQPYRQKSGTCFGKYAVDI